MESSSASGWRCRSVTVRFHRNKNNASTKSDAAGFSAYVLDGCTGVQSGRESRTAHDWNLLRNVRRVIGDLFETPATDRQDRDQHVQGIDHGVVQTGSRIPSAGFARSSAKDGCGY